jgi:alpha-methylacyl-CoA racemase
LRALSPDPVWQPGISLSLQAGAVAAVIGIQSALLERARTSEGAFLDISLAEAAGWHLTCGVNPLSERPFSIPSTPDRRLYLCGDGRYVAVASSEPRTWGALCDALGIPELKGTLHQANGAVPTAQKLEELFHTRPAADWVEHLAPRGATITVVNHGQQVVEDQHVIARQAVIDVGGTPVPANPIRVQSADGRSTGTATSIPPQVGADTTDILRAAGFSTDELETFSKLGLIE